MAGIEMACLWRDMPNDLTWWTSARFSDQRTSNVIGVWTHVIVDAYANSDECENGATRISAAHTWKRRSDSREAVAGNARKRWPAD